MALDVTGKIIQIMAPSNGTSKAGKDWVKQEFVVEIQDVAYPKKVCISMMGDKTRELEKFPVGSDVKVSLNLESREFNGKWYTNVNGWRIEGANAGSGSAPSSSQENSYSNEAPTSFSSSDNSSDDLPF